MKRILFSSFLILLSLSMSMAAHAQSCTNAVCNANSASESDVLAALPSSSNTNPTVVVNIPSGTGLWTSQINYGVPAAVTNLTIQGNTSVNCTGTAGTSGYSCTATDSTIIQDNYASNASPLNITAAGNNTHLRLTGLTFQGGTGSIKYYGLFIINGPTHNLRLDHLHIDQTTYSPVTNGDYGIGLFGEVEGVADHNLFDNTSPTSNQIVQGLYIANSINDSTGYGDGTWNSPTDFGQSDFFFVEANVFNGGLTEDCDIAGRFVVRYNTMNNQSTNSASIHAHGTKTPGSRWRGCRAYEAYHNAITGNSSTANAAIGLAGGTSLVWANTIVAHYNNFSQIAAPRNDGEETETANPNGWGYCGTSWNGTGSNWDGNSSSTTGYPCLDGLGRGQGDLLNGKNFPNAQNTVTSSISFPHEKLEPIYYFNNKLGGINELVISDRSTQLNRDVYIDSSSFNGTSGTGSGLLAARPATCTAGPGGTYGTSPTGSYGVGYWATDANSGNGELYVCTAANTWTGIYQPYAYPHPLVSGNSTTSGTPPAPTGLVSTVY